VDLDRCPDEFDVLLKKIKIILNFQHNLKLWTETVDQTSSTEEIQVEEEKVLHRFEEARGGRSSYQGDQHDSRPGNSALIE
jgi:hypothetical protein